MKMTRQRINRLKYKIQDARTSLLMKLPFFALVLMHLEFYATRDINTISTNGSGIFFSPDFIDKLYPEELEFLLCHTLLHIILDDVGRPIDYKGAGYHHACDMVNNEILREYGYKRRRYPHFGEIYDDPKRWLEGENLTPLRLYHALPYDLSYIDEEIIKNFMIDTDKMWDHPIGYYDEFVRILGPDENCDRIYAKYVTEEETPPPGGEGNEAEADGSGETENAPGSAQELARVIASALKVLKGSDGEGNLGQVSLLEKRMRLKTRKSKVDWRSVLIDFVQEEIMDYSFTPPDRRLDDSPFFLPDFNVPEEKVKDILFMVDTSGSMSDEAVTTAYSEIRGAIEQFDGKLSGWLGFFDMEVVPPIPFDGVGELMKILPKGGGGTSFYAVFDYLRRNRENYKPSSIVILTDGFGEFPEESAAMGIPVLWLLDSREADTPPWGRIAYIDEQGL